MTTTSKPLLALTASDVMNPNVVTISQDMSLRAAAHLLFQKQIGGAPVVDSNGRCIGVLSANDFVQWAHEGGSGAEDVPLSACPFRTKGRLLTGQDAMICVLEEGSCRFQNVLPTTGGRHTSVCLLPRGEVSKWQVKKDVPVSAVLRYMNTYIDTVGPLTPLRDIARKMVEAHIHRVYVVDEQHKPIGVVLSTDVLAALAYDRDEL